MTTLGTNISGGDTLLYDGVKIYDLVSRARILNNLHSRMILGPFEKILHKGSLWRGTGSVISFIIRKK